MSVIDENKSWYFEENLRTHAPNAEKSSNVFVESNRMHSMYRGQCLKSLIAVSGLEIV